jgi:protein gp37
MAKSTIEWTESTWNPITGCTKISAGCKNCYASILSKRLQAMGQKKYQNGFAPTMHPDTLGDPFKWKNGKLVFVNSMSDSFHKEFPLSFIQQMFNVMNETPRHTYQVLTKRAERLEELSTFLNWTDNIWMGVSVENEKTIDRIEHLRKTGAKVKFLSCEPLIGPLTNINLEGIDWVIVGGESGPNSRPMEKEWVEDIQQQCEKAGVAFFFKQWGGVNKKKTGRLLNGRTYDEMPSIA